MKDGKIWGTTETILATPLIEVHRLSILPKARCSWHMHAAKHNAFLVQSGTLIIERRKKEYALIDRTRLQAGELCNVPPGEFHRFVTEHSGALAVEIYYPQMLTADIVREDVGGVGDVESGSKIRDSKSRGSK